MTLDSGSNTMQKKLSCRDWIVMITLPLTGLLSQYDNFSLGGILPLLRDDFNLTDSEAASIKTFGTLAHGSAFAVMWLFGDFMPKKATFVLFVALWSLFNLGSTMATSNTFWLFVVLRSLASLALEVFRIILTVLQAEHFTGKHLTAALTANIVADSVAVLLSSSINSIFVANNSNWRLAVAIGPVLAIPLIISAAIFLRPSRQMEMPHPMSILRNAIGVLRIPSYLLMVLSQCVTMFYSLSLMFWLSSLILDALETNPDVFLGLSYPVISSLTAVIVFPGMLIGAFVVPYLNQTLEAGSCLFSCLPPTQLAIPIVYAVSSALETLTYLMQVTMITTSFSLFAAAFFIDGLAGCGITLNNLQIILSTTPASQRASALSMLRLMMAIGNLPATQIIGALSDYFRGDSTASVDRLQALQKTFLYTWVMPVASTMMCLVILRFYKADVKRAKEIDQEDKEESFGLV